MGIFDDCFKNTKCRATKESTAKALQLLTKEKIDTHIVPKSVKDKVKYAEDMSIKVFGDKLKDLELLDNEEGIEHYIDYAINQGVIAVDTETNGLDRVDGKIAGVCLYTPGEKGIYIPIGHVSYMTNLPIKDNISKEFMKKQFEKMNKANIKYIFHNAKFDMHILYWMLGVVVIPYWDTLIGAYLLNENERHGLKYLYHKYIAKESEAVGKFNELFNGIEFNRIPPKVAYMYAAFDPKMTYDLYKFQEQYLDEDNPKCIKCGLEKVARVFRDIEMPILPVLFKMEVQGVDIDTDLCDRLRTQYTKYRDEAKESFKNKIAELNRKGAFDTLQIRHYDKYLKLCSNGILDVNIGSSTQLAILFYDVLNLQSPDPKSPRGTGEYIIKKFNNPIVDDILEYRAMDKLISTYLDAIPAHISNRDNKLHANFNQYGAKTGRMSSSDPNLQNIPSQQKTLKSGIILDAGHDIRQMFIAGEGQVIVGGDFS